MNVVTIMLAVGVAITAGGTTWLILDLVWRALVGRLDREEIDQ